MPSFLVPVLIVLAVFLVAWVVQRSLIARGIDTAPGWRLRCTGCNRTRPAAEAGVVRIGARGTKHTISRCSSCGGLRHLVIERVPETA